MAVLPINSVSVVTNQYAFTGRKDKKNSHKANTLAGLPVVVMLAMAPLSTDGKQPAQFVPIDNAHITELVAAVNANAPKTYAETQAPQSTYVSHEAIQDLEYYKSRKILHIQNIKGNRAPAALIFRCPVAIDAPTVAKVEYIDNNYLKKQINDPAWVIGLVYHNLGAGKDFCSIITSETYKENNTYKILEREIKVDDETAQLLIDLIAGDTKWKNKSEIKFYETIR
jgi:hypothetical protein